MKLMIRLCLGIATCGLLLGCIENPGPDKNLGQEKAKRFTSIFGRNSNRPLIHYILDLEVKRIDGLEHLFVENIGASLFGFAEIRLILTQSPHYYGLHSWDPVPLGIAYERYIKIVDLQAGEKIDIGILDSVTFYMGVRWKLSADFLSIVIEEDSAINSNLGGFYSGTYSKKSNSGWDFKGNISGAFDINGNITLLTESRNPDTGFPIRGIISLDSSGQSGKFIELIYNDRIWISSGKVRRVDDSLSLTVVGSFNAEYIPDTLNIFLKRYIPTKTLITNIEQPGKFINLPSQPPPNE
jgi:hypothetical protein